MKLIKCVVFDMDGTLTETAPLIYESFNYVALKYTGRTYSVSEIISKFGPPEEVVIESFVDKQKVNEAMDDYLTFYRKHHKKLARLFPGIEEVLKIIKERGAYLTIFTGKGKRTADITLQEFSIDKYFDYVITGNDVKNHKPSSDGLKMIMDYFKLKPEQMLMVGDSKADVEAAHDAKIRIAAVMWDSYAGNEILSMGADNVFHNVQEFQEWLITQI